jgi:TPR repeat protein
MLRRGEGGPADEAAARALFEKGCAGGEPDGCFFLGLELAQSGDPGARSMFARACAAGDRVACDEGKP